MTAKAMLQGETDAGRIMFAAVDPSARYSIPIVSPIRFGAMLAPFSNHQQAEAALTAAGAVLIVPVDSGGKVRR